MKLHWDDDSQLKNKMHVPNHQPAGYTPCAVNNGPNDRAQWGWMMLDGLTLAQRWRRRSKSGWVKSCGCTAVDLTHHAGVWESSIRTCPHCVPANLDATRINHCRPIQIIATVALQVSSIHNGGELGHGPSQSTQVFLRNL